MGRKDGSTLLGAEKSTQSLPGASEKPPKEPQGAVLGSSRAAAVDSWAAVGIDTSMTSIAAVSVGYDGVTKKRVGPVFGEIRWMPEDDYFKRLADAARAHDLVLSLLRELWVVDPSRVFIAFEEPIFFGATKSQESSFIKQQCEVAGACKGGIARYGFTNFVEINNSQWHATLRKDGVEFERGTKDTPKAEKTAIRYRNKFRVKDAMIAKYGLPDIPDLVASRSGAKIPRPESGYGAKAKAVQPSDIFDAAAVMQWLVEDLVVRGVIDPW